MPFTQNNNHSLMGFSVHQPFVGAALQFFPSMGSKQLDEMIDAYVPGSASILDKRTVVTCEFVQHSIATGELFKFFMVYPSNASDSFESPVSLQDSGYGSFNTSPVMSESQWTSASSSSSSQARSASKKTAAADFSHLPGMKIMTRDGLDVTNSASRGCKTKEQRDHAHLMRIIKACESCRKKKIRCDPSHKKRSSHPLSPEPKTSKKAKKSSPVASKAAPAPQLAVSHSSTVLTSVLSNPEVPPFEANNPLDWDMPSFDSFVPTDEVDIFAEMEGWDQFINYGDESAAVQQEYNFNGNHFSPTTTFTNSTSPSQLVTPAARGLSSDGFEFASAGDFTARGSLDHVGAFANSDPAPTLPYLNPGGVEGGTNYIDFNLYSPGSSSDEDLGFSQDIAAAPLEQQGFDRVERGGRIELDRHHPSSEHKHKIVCSDPMADSDKARQSVSQYHAPADIWQATINSNEGVIETSNSLYDQSRSSLQSGADAVRSTGLARPNKQRVPGDEQTHPSLIPPHAPAIPGRPRDACVCNDGPCGPRAVLQTSDVISEASLSRVSRSTSQDSVTTTAVHSDTSLNAPTSQSLRTASRDASSAVKSVDKRSRVHDDRQTLSRTSVTIPGPSIDDSGIQSVLEGRIAATLLSRTDLSERAEATSSAVAKLFSATYLAANGRSSQTDVVQNKQSKAHDKKPQNGDARRTANLQGALDISRNDNSTIVENAGALATIGLTTALSATSVAISSNAAYYEFLTFGSLSVAALLWPLSRRHTCSGIARQSPLGGPNGECLAQVGQGLLALPCLRQTLAVSYLAALTFSPVAMSLHYGVAMMVSLVVFAVLSRPLFAQTNKQKASLQPPSLARGSHNQAFDLTSDVHPVTRNVSQIQSRLGRVLPTQSSRAIRDGSRQILML